MAKSGVTCEWELPGKLFSRPDGGEAMVAARAPDLFFLITRASEHADGGRRCKKKGAIQCLAASPNGPPLGSRYSLGHNYIVMAYIVMAYIVMADGYPSDPDIALAITLRLWPIELWPI